MSSTLENRRRESIPLAGDEVAEAVEVLGAGGAAVEVGAHTRDAVVGCIAGERQLDIVVELLEAPLAGQLRRTGTEAPAENLIALHHSSSPPAPTRKPRAARAARSLR